jgi:hypothetical protein
MLFILFFFIFFIWFFHHFLPPASLLCMLTLKKCSWKIVLFFQGNVTMQGVDGSTNVFVKKGDVDIQVQKQNMYQIFVLNIEFRKQLKYRYV